MLLYLKKLKRDSSGTSTPTSVTSSSSTTTTPTTTSSLPSTTITNQQYSRIGLNESKHRFENAIIYPKPKQSNKSSQSQSQSSQSRSPSNIIIIDSDDDHDTFIPNAKDDLGVQSIEWELDEFEIFQHVLSSVPASIVQPILSTPTNSSNKSEVIGEECYISLDRLDTEKKITVVGVLKQEGHKYYNKTIRFNINDYSIMNGGTHWSLWIKESASSVKYPVWFKVLKPHDRYRTVHNTFQQKYNLVEQTAIFLQSKVEKNLSNLEVHLRLKVQGYADGDIERAGEFVNQHIPKLVDFNVKTKKLLDDLLHRAQYMADYQSYGLSRLFSSRAPIDWHITKKKKLDNLNITDDKLKKINQTRWQMIRNDIGSAVHPPNIVLSGMPQGMLGYHTYNLAKGSLANHPTLEVVSESHEYSEFSKDVLPLLQCMICGSCRQLGGVSMTSATDPSIPMSKDIIESLEDYLRHLEQHKADLDKSLNAYEYLSIQTRSFINQFRIRTVVETIQESSNNQLVQQQQQLNNNNNNNTNIQKKQLPIHWPTSNNSSNQHKRKH